MKIVTPTQMREIDRRSIEDLGIPGQDLMERAGAAVASAVESCLNPDQLEPFVVLLVGKGNNGGDALVAARLLAEKGIKTLTFLLAEAMVLKGDAALNMERLARDKAPLRELVDDEGLVIIRKSLAEADAIVDGIFGTGFKGSARGISAEVIKLVNQISRARPAIQVIAADIPSGLAGETGLVEGEAIRADRTVTMGLPKTGMVRGEGLNYCGRIIAADIGIPPSVIEEVSADLELIAGPELSGLLPPRPRTSHKGNYGHLLVLAGSPGMTGAATLTSLGALRSGSGLVTLGIPESLNPILEEKCTEVMTLPLPETAAGTLSPDALSPILDFCRKADAVALGPGLSRNPETGELVKGLVQSCPVPLVIDADGLNLIADDLPVLQGFKPDLILTPHPGEFCRLTGLSKEELFADREGMARRFARENNLTLVLKGAGTLIASPDGPLRINLNGNPGMATGGTGDILTGLIAGFIVGGLSGIDAASLGVFVHGAAGDKAAEEVGEISLIASDLLKTIPAVLKELFPWNK
ncbi:MAG: NAD(P)H-hydrate dehydratase [Candidatus Auribacterota bacterium]|nr:NAD(P)H-hydrate dehydratase [Candidatus Auribacterota bacterium]